MSRRFLPTTGREGGHFHSSKCQWIIFFFENQSVTLSRVKNNSHQTWKNIDPKIFGAFGAGSFHWFFLPTGGRLWPKKKLRKNQSPPLPECRPVTHWLYQCLYLHQHQYLYLFLKTYESWKNFGDRWKEPWQCFASRRAFKSLPVVLCTLTHALSLPWTNFFYLHESFTWPLQNKSQKLWGKPRWRSLMTFPHWLFSPHFTYQPPDQQLKERRTIYEFADTSKGLLIIIT